MGQTVGRWTWRPAAWNHWALLKGGLHIYADMDKPAEVSLALVVMAKRLYFEFRTVAYIEAQTGLDAKWLRTHIYGHRGARNPSIDSWYYERATANDEEFAELSARNHWLAHQFTQKALYESYESMKLLGERTYKNGKKKPLRAGEIRAIADTVATMNKLLRLSQGLPTEIVDETHHLGTTPQELAGPQDIVLDMTKVAQALLLDPAMNKLVKGAINEAQGTSEAIETVAAGPVSAGGSEGADVRGTADDLLSVDGTAGTVQPNGARASSGEGVADSRQPRGRKPEASEMEPGTSADRTGPSEREGSGSGRGEPETAPPKAAASCEPNAPSEPSGLPPSDNRPAEAPRSSGTGEPSASERTGWEVFTPEFDGF